VQHRRQDPPEAADLSDGLDVDAIERIHRHFQGRVRIGYGWGTLLTNDFRGLGPDGRLDSLLHRLQGGIGQRPAGSEALRQSLEAMGPPEELAVTAACSRSASRFAPAGRRVKSDRRPRAPVLPPEAD